MNKSFLETLLKQVFQAQQTAEYQLLIFHQIEVFPASRCDVSSALFLFQVHRHILEATFEGLGHCNIAIGLAISDLLSGTISAF